MSDFRPVGVFPALPTPITDDGTINYETSENHIQYVEDGGVDGLVPAGCTGHAASLGDMGDSLYDEHVEYVSRVADIADLPVIAGDGLNSTAQTIELASRIEDEADIDAHLMISPYQNGPPQDMITEHYRQIAGAVDEPIIAYNVPGRTGRNIEADTALDIGEIDGVVGLKEASLDYQQIHEIGMGIQVRGLDDFYLGSGDDSANHYVFQQGGDFVISVSANVYPDAVREVWELGQEGDHVAAYERNQELAPLHDAMFQTGEKNPMSVHYALNRMGFDFGTPRMPLDRHPREDGEFQNRSEVEEVLDHFGLIDEAA